MLFGTQTRRGRWTSFVAVGERSGTIELPQDIYERFAEIAGRVIGKAEWVPAYVAIERDHVSIYPHYLSISNIRTAIDHCGFLTVERGDLRKFGVTKRIKIVDTGYSVEVWDYDRFAIHDTVYKSEAFHLLEKFQPDKAS